jgi:cell wall-associated NlpC family hydrolase
MSNQLAERRARTARVSPDAHKHFTVIIFTLFAASLLFSGCSPYPMYTATPHPQSQIVQHDPSNEADPDPGWTTETRSRDEESAEDDRMPVQPTIFSRVVEDYLGVPYALGGGSADGIDCSNLVRVLYRDYDGTRLPASTSRLYNLPNSVLRDELAVGDLVFFTFGGSSDVSHVGVYLGDGRFVHASESRGVIISSLKDAAYKDRYAGARRVQ